MNKIMQDREAAMAQRAAVRAMARRTLAAHPREFAQPDDLAVARARKAAALEAVARFRFYRQG